MIGVFMSNDHILDCFILVKYTKFCVTPEFVSSQSIICVWLMPSWSHVHHYTLTSGFGIVQTQQNLHFFPFNRPPQKTVMIKYLAFWLAKPQEILLSTSVCWMSSSQKQAPILNKILFIFFNIEVTQIIWFVLGLIKKSKPCQMT